MSRPVTRRALLGSGLVILGGAAGTAVGLTRPLPVRTPPVPPAALTDSVTREHRLIARLDSSIAAGNRDPRLRVVRADHVAHLAALQAAVQDIVRPTASPTAPVPSLPPLPPASLTQLGSAETDAAKAAAAASTVLTGRVAVVLASIAACETTHAKLLT